jgi:two-component system phosphate regulon sensor histidine kinase PhoR
MRKNAIRLVVLLGAISVIGIVLTQIYWVKKELDLKDKEFNQTVQIALRNVAEDMAQYGQFSLPPKDVINQVSTDYYVVNINNTIDAKTLEFYLIKEFNAVGINTDFDYGIYDCSSDKMVYGNYISFTPKDAKDKVVKSLPKLDKFTYYFGVRFPDRSSYVVSRMDNWVFTSIILLVVIIFFGYAMFVILQQKRLSEMQRDFINNMTHEFKTPISTIAISSDVIANPHIVETPERLSTYAGIIKEEAGRLNRQVEKVLQIAKEERNEFRLNKEQVDLHELVKNAADSFGVTIHDKQGKITLDLKAANHTVNADRQHLANVIYNLLDNAVKYTNEAPLIKIGTVNLDKKILLSVQDNGIGIKKEYQRKIFDKFFRVPSGNLHNVKGFGLGLSYVRNIVNAHGWKIKVDSEPGKGSTFTLEIPV